MKVQKKKNSINFIKSIVTKNYVKIEQRLEKSILLKNPVKKLPVAGFIFYIILMFLIL